jgi:glucose-6-phosphate isomerase
LFSADLREQTATMPGFSQATDLAAWKALAEHHKTLSQNIVLKEYFKEDPQRFEKYSHVFKGADGGETLFDFSKNFLNDETLSLLVNLAKEAGLEELRDCMFAGDKINFTENRAVYHVALRNVSKVKMEVNGKSVVDDVDSVLLHMKEFSNQVRSGEWKGYTGKKIETIVNIGIGGSDLSVIATDRFSSNYGLC